MTRRWPTRPAEHSTSSSKTRSAVGAPDGTSEEDTHRPEDSGEVLDDTGEPPAPEVRAHCFR